MIVEMILLWHTYKVIVLGKCGYISNSLWSNMTAYSVSGRLEEKGIESPNEVREIVEGEKGLIQQNV